MHLDNREGLGIKVELRQPKAEQNFGQKSGADSQRPEGHDGHSTDDGDSDNIDNGAGGRRTSDHRAAATKATDHGKKVTEMILECDEDADASDDDGDSVVGGPNLGCQLDNGSHNEDESFVSDSGSGAGGGGGEAAGSMFSRKPVKTRWSAQEDAWLKESVEAHGNSNWKRVC